MKKRLFALLLTLALMFSVLPGAVLAAEPAGSEKVNCGILDAARGKLIRLSGLTGSAILRGKTSSARSSPG